MVRSADRHIFTGRGRHMIGRIGALHQRYAQRHLRIVSGPRAIRNDKGDLIGRLDSVELSGETLVLTGWALGERVSARRGDESLAEVRPERLRTDLSGQSPRQDVGFRLTVPSAAGRVTLRVTPADGDPATPDLAVPRPRRWPAEALVAMGFAGAILSGLPILTKYAMTRDPALHSRAKKALGLDGPPPSRPLDPAFTGPPQAAPRADGQGRPTILMPVYNGHRLLGEALDRIRRHTPPPWHLILVEDASTDERILPLLRAFAEDPPDGAQVTLIVNDGNLGFIGSVNRAFRAALDGQDQGPVILVNSDAFVPADWIGRLTAPLADPSVATVTPMSNDAEIFSVPALSTRHVLAPGQMEAIDADAATLGALPAAEAPTGVGFCMALSRVWLGRLPQLDQAFGRGYGEEVDWCQKVLRMGGRHLGIPTLFVAHEGGESFGSAEKLALIAKNSAVIAGRYPSYDADVQSWITKDPLATARMALGMTWAGSLGTTVPVYVAHDMGGGADLWLDRRIAADVAPTPGPVAGGDGSQGPGAAVVLRVGGQRRVQVELHAPAGIHRCSTDDLALIRPLLHRLTRMRIVYSCAVGDTDPASLPAMLAGLLRPQDSAEVLFHDFFPISPAYTLLGTGLSYRGVPGEDTTDPAHHARRPTGGRMSVGEWRAAWRPFLASADTLRVFGQSSAEIVSAAYPDLAGAIQVTPHALGDLPPPMGRRGALPTKLGVLGNISPQKGAAIVQALAARRDFQTVLVGRIDPAYPLPSRATLYGPYKPMEITGIAERHGITHWVIPSICPETFCFTAYEAIATGLPVLAFDIGGQGDAVRGAPNGVPVPFDPDADLAARIADAALA